VILPSPQHLKVRRRRCHKYLHRTWVRGSTTENNGLSSRSPVIRRGAKPANQASETEPLIADEGIKRGLGRETQGPATQHTRTHQLRRQRLQRCVRGRIDGRLMRMLRNIVGLRLRLMPRSNAAARRRRPVLRPTATWLAMFAQQKRIRRLLTTTSASRGHRSVQWTG
jgi:hypothetical protein